MLSDGILLKYLPLSAVIIKSCQHFYRSQEQEEEEVVQWPGSLAILFSLDYSATLPPLFFMLL